MNTETVQMVRLKWFSGQLLVLLALWTVSALDMARGWVWFGVIVATLLVTVNPALPDKIPPLIRKLVTPLLIVVFIADLITSGADLIPPLIRLLLILMVLRVVMPRKNREDLQLVLLAMFLSVVSGVFTLSMLFAVQAFIFAIISIGLLYLVNLLESSEEKEGAGGEWEAFSWREFSGFLIDSFSGRMVRSLAVLLLLLLATTGILFVSIPRVYLDQAIPFLRLSVEGLSGFNDTVRFGDVTRIQEDDGVAMRIDVPGIEAIPADPYWRMLILDRYDDGAFTNSLFVSPGGTRTLPQVHRISPYPATWFSDIGETAGTWTFYIEGGVSRYLPVLGPFMEMTFQGRQPLQANPQVLVFRIQEATTSVFSYQVEDFLIGSSVPGAAIDRPLWENELPEGRVEESRYPFTTLGLPLEEDEKEYLRSLVGSILGDVEADPVERAAKILGYLRSQHRYTLSPGGFGEGDPVIEWLRQGRAGHCELFAGAFTLLARAAGIPSRMVVGFSGGAWNSYEDYFVVRNRNAHAWAEIFDGKDWVRFDPTPGGANARGAADGMMGGMGFLQESDFQAWIDSLRVMWYRRVINFDDSSQEELVSGISSAVQRIGSELKTALVEVWKRIVVWFRAGLESLKESGVAWVVLSSSILLAGAVLWFFLRGPGILWLMMSSRKGLSPLRKQAGRELRRLDKVDAEFDQAMRKQELRERLLEVRFGQASESARALSLFREVKRFVRGKSRTV